MDPTKWTDKQIEKYINDFYDGVTSANVLPAWLYNETRDRLFKGVTAGFGGTMADFVDGSPELDLLKHYEYNIAIFSGAKSFQQAKEVSDFVFQDGEKMSFKDFETKAAAVFDEYNVRWLETEYRVANNTALLARNWLNIKETADIFPYLRYLTTGDDRVRPDHAALDGIIRPVNDPFWSRYYPPNDWNCRCNVEQLADDEIAEFGGVTPDDVVAAAPEPSILFDGNAAVDKIVFDPRSPYFLVADRYAFLKSNNFNLPTPPKPK